MIVVIDYGAGNVTSIVKMLHKIGEESVVANRADVIEKATKIILPGVGHFDYGMEQLHRLKLEQALQKKVLVDRIPILGICLGAQLMTKSSEEGNAKGLGFIKARAIKFCQEEFESPLKIPHMGWSDTFAVKPSNLIQGLTDPRFYFVHSYHVVCENYQDVLFESSYGYDFVAAYEIRNIVGVQFHPEKSHRFGMQLLSNYVKLM